MLRVPSRRGAMGTFRKASVGVGAVVAGIVGVANYSNSPQQSIYDFGKIKSAPFVRLDTGVEVTGAELWSRHGAVIHAIRRPGCPLVRRQGLGLTEMELGPVPLYGVVLEKIETEPDKFKQAVWNRTGDRGHEMVLDATKSMFPLKNQGSLGLLRLGTIKNMITLMSDGQKVTGTNVLGEYDNVGGVMVIGPGDQGIVYEAYEKEMGDTFDLQAIYEAIGNFNPAPEATPSANPRAKL